MDEQVFLFQSQISLFFEKTLALHEFKGHLIGLFTLPHFPKPFCFIYYILSQGKRFGI